MQATVKVTQVVRVTIDESKFDDEFMEEFRRFMFPFNTLDEHIEHLGQLYARNIAGNYGFIEGYGHASEMGISFEDVSGDQELLPQE